MFTFLPNYLISLSLLLFFHPTTFFFSFSLFPYHVYISSLKAGRQKGNKMQPNLSWVMFFLGGQHMERCMPEGLLITLIEFTHYGTQSGQWALAFPWNSSSECQTEMTIGNIKQALFFYSCLFLTPKFWFNGLVLRICFCPHSLGVFEGQPVWAPYLTNGSKWGTNPA